MKYPFHSSANIEIVFYSLYYLHFFIIINFELNNSTKNLTPFLCMCIIFLRFLCANLFSKCIYYCQLSISAHHGQSLSTLFLFFLFPHNNSSQSTRLWIVPKSSRWDSFRPPPPAFLFNARRRKKKNFFGRIHQALR